MSEVYFVTKPVDQVARLCVLPFQVEELMHPLYAVVRNAQLLELVTEELTIQCEEGLLGDAHDLLQVVCLVVQDLLTPNLAISDTIHFGANALNCSCRRLLACLIISWLIDLVSASNLFLEHLIGVPSSKRLGSWVKVLAKGRNSIIFASAASTAALLGKSAQAFKLAYGVAEAFPYLQLRNLFPGHVVLWEEVRTLN